MEAVADYSYLLEKGYSHKAALSLVGDHYQLHMRQRFAVQRGSCSSKDIRLRASGQISLEDILDRKLGIDGFNLVITIETALAGGVIIKGRDSCYRDLASIGGNYRKVDQTRPSIQLIGDFLKNLKAEKIVWYFDRKVSNSGKLKELLVEMSQQNKWNWEIQLDDQVDQTLINFPGVVASSDGEILAQTKSWVNLIKPLLDTVSSKIMVDLSN